MSYVADGAPFSQKFSVFFIDIVFHIDNNRIKLSVLKYPHS